MSFLSDRTSHGRARGFTLIEIMITVAIIGIVLGIAGPTWIKQRTLSQQAVCQENLTKINGAKEQWALENNKATSTTPGWDDLVQEDGGGYLKKLPVCPASGDYTIGPVGQIATCSVTQPLDHNP